MEKKYLLAAPRLATLLSGAGPWVRLITYLATMKYFICAAAMSLPALPAAAQAQLNLPLKRELDSLYAVDQCYRAMLFDPRINRNPDSLATALGVAKPALNATIMRQMQRTDSSNLGRVLVILRQYGYPGKSLVGEPTNRAVWSVIQHAPRVISQYLPLMKLAAEKGELPFTRYATMLDRQLQTEGKEQLYGTQAVNFNSQPPFIWPIQNPAQVNQLRKQAGFSTTVEESAAAMGVPYQLITLADVAKMPK